MSDEDETTYFSLPRTTSVGSKGIRRVNDMFEGMRRASGSPSASVSDKWHTPHSSYSPTFSDSNSSSPFGDEVLQRTPRANANIKISRADTLKAPRPFQTEKQSDSWAAKDASSPPQGRSGSVGGSQSYRLAEGSPEGRRVLQELDDLRSRVQQLEMVSPVSSQPTESLASYERTRTAQSSISTPPLASNNYQDFGPGGKDSILVNSTSYPLLRSALAKVRPYVNNEVYRALEGVSSHSQRLSGIVSERAAQHGADNVCRSLTELCLALSHPQSPQNVAAPSAHRPSSTASSPRRRMGGSRLSMLHSSQGDYNDEEDYPPRMPSRAATDSIAERNALEPKYGHRSKISIASSLPKNCYENSVVDMAPNKSLSAAAFESDIGPGERALSRASYHRSTQRSAEERQGREDSFHRRTQTLYERSSTPSSFRESLSTERRRQIPSSLSSRSHLDRYLSQTRPEARQSTLIDGYRE